MRRGSPAVTVDAGVVQTPGERPAFDKEVDLEARQQHVVERPDDELVLADGKTRMSEIPATALAMAASS